MITRKRLGCVLWVCAMVGILAQGTWANNNFKAQSNKTGCDSIITPDGVEACRRVQRAMNEACNQRTECDPSKQERDADAYKKKRENFLAAPEHERKDESRRRNLRDMYNELEDRRRAATAGETIAANCIRARDAVQRWFEDTAIPLTERMRNSAAGVRKDLADKHAEAVRRRDDAKKRLDESPPTTVCEGSGSPRARRSARRRASSRSSTCGSDPTSSTTPNA